MRVNDIILLAENIGGIGFVNKGNWDNAVNYELNDVVKYGDSTYVAKRPNVGVTPPTNGTDTEDWFYLVNGSDYARTQGNETITFKVADATELNEAVNKRQLINHTVNLTSALNTKVDKSVTITAGTGLSGGGTLSDDRTLSVDYGTTAGTAAQGNDSRIVGAAQKTYVDDELNKKVDKVDGKGLSDTNFTQVEKDKLSTVEQDAQKNTVNSVAGKQGDVLLDKSDVGLGAVDNTSDVDKPVSTAVVDALDDKVDKVVGKQLSDENFSQVEKDKLSGIAEEATKNRADSLNADKIHIHTISQVTGLDAILGSKASKTELTDGLELKVDKVVGKQLSDTNFTQTEKDKLAFLESSKFVGLFVSESALPTTGSDGDYANVDGGVGNDVYRVIWDSSDNKWVRVQGVSTDPTDAQIKQQYESNPDTNAFTDVEKTKLAGIATGATKNRADSANADKVHTHTTVQITGLDDALEGKVDKVTGKGLSDTNYTQAEKNKLDGIATGATKNATDAQLRNRATHTGVQPIASVSGLQSELSWC